MEPVDGMHGAPNQPGDPQPYMGSPVGPAPGLIPPSTPAPGRDPCPPSGCGPGSPRSCCSPLGAGLGLLSVLRLPQAGSVVSMVLTDSKSGSTVK